MRLAWLRAHAPREHDPLDDIAALLLALRADHDIDVFPSETLRDLAPSHGRSPFDLGVSEVTDAATATALSGLTVPLDRVLLVRTLAIDGLPALVRGSKMVIVPHRGVADDLRTRFPGMEVRIATTGVSAVSESRRGQAHAEERRGPVVIGMFPPTRADVVRRALAREGAGAAVVVEAGWNPRETFEKADIVVSISWPWAGEPPVETLVAMASTRPVVTLETVGTAEWPALDPQSWQTRGPGSDAPIVVSIDPLDEEHSLGLALARLSKDSALRTQLGTTARAWWQSHATPAHAAADWKVILSEAQSLTTRSAEAV